MGQAMWPAQAQESFMRWAAIDRNDLAMTTYPADSSASAVVLDSFCYMYFNFVTEGGGDAGRFPATRCLTGSTNGLRY
jgi:hypothetical protein